MRVNMSYTFDRAWQDYEICCYFF